MKKKTLICLLIIVLSCLSLTACFGSGGGGGGSEKEKIITLSCGEVFAGKKALIESETNYDFDYYHKDNTWKIVGDNTVGAEFTFEKRDNFYYTYITAKNEGIVKVQLINNTYSKPIESNILEIEVKKLVGADVKTVQDLQKMNGDNAYELKNDIDLADFRWTPINNFKGVINGNGHTIYNLKISNRSGNMGMFTAFSGSINDVNFEQASVRISGENKQIGIIAGANYGSIINCKVGGEVNAKYSNRIGGIAGYNEGVILDCENNAKIEGNSDVGGIVGHAKSGTAKNLVNNGEIFGNIYVGGISGDLRTQTTENLVNNGIVNCKDLEGESYTGGVVGKLISENVVGLKNLGEVKARGDYVGGVIGYAECAVIDETTVENQAPVAGGDYTGGFIGKTASDIRGLQNTAIVSGDAYVGGVVGYNQGKISDCTNNGEVISNNYMTFNDNSNQDRVYTGGIAGFNQGDMNLCENLGIITIKRSGNNVGGVVGQILGNISDCKNQTPIANGFKWIGGVAGYVDEGSVINCENNGDISGHMVVGGITGNVEQNIEDCTNNGIITCDDEFAGGISGGVSGDIINCTNTGNVTGKYDVGGFTGYLEGKALDLTNNVEVTGHYNVGGIVGRIDNNGSADNLINNGLVKSTGMDDNGNSYIGGIVGNTTIDLINCQNNNEITATGDFVGGLAGACGRLTDCKNMGNIKGRTQVGGLVGKANGIIGNCINNGESVTGTGDKVGGIAGSVDNNMDTCENTATVTGVNMVGGFAGYMTGKTFALTNTAKVIGNTKVGGIIGHLDGGKENVGDTLVNEGEVVATGKDNKNNTYVGGIAGYANATFRSCKNYVPIKGIGHYVGGIVGYMCGNITDSENNNNVNGANYVGGIVGYSEDDISTCTQTGSVKGETYVGGIAGHINGLVQGLENNSAVEGNIYVGGIAGYMANGKELVNNGKITALGKDQYNNTYIGGITGYANNTLDTCSNTTSINGKGDYVGGIAGFAAIVNNSTNSLNVYSDGSIVGGIAGQIGAKAENNTNSATVQGVNNVGGITGIFMCYNSVGECNFIGNTNTGNVQGQNFVGGCAGGEKARTDRHSSYNVIMKINSNVNKGAVSGNKFVGGILAGYDYDLDNQRNAYTGVSRHSIYIESNDNQGKVSGSEYVAGIVGYLRLILKQTFNGNQDAYATIRQNNNAGEILCHTTKNAGIIAYASGSADYSPGYWYYMRINIYNSNKNSGNLTTNANQIIAEQGEYVKTNVAEN